PVVDEGFLECLVQLAIATPAERGDRVSSRPRHRRRLRIQVDHHPEERADECKPAAAEEAGAALAVPEDRHAGLRRTERPRASLDPGDDRPADTAAEGDRVDVPVAVVAPVATLEVRVADELVTVQHETTLGLAKPPLPDVLRARHLRVVAERSVERADQLRD